MKKEYIGEDCKGEDIEPVGIDEANAALDEFACDLLQDPVILFDGQAHIGDEVIDIPKVAEPAPKPKRKPREKKEIDTSSVNFYDLPTDLIADFKKHRKAKKATITQRVVDSIKREAESIGWTLEKAVEEMINRGWQGFKAEWVNRSTSIPKKEGTGVNRKTFGPEVYAGCDDTWGF